MNTEEELEREAAKAHVDDILRQMDKEGGPRYGYSFSNSNL